jgi:hypothetical protein
MEACIRILQTKLAGHSLRWVVKVSRFDGASPQDNGVVIRVYIFS